MSDIRKSYAVAALVTGTVAALGLSPWIAVGIFAADTVLALALRLRDARRLRAARAEVMRRKYEGEAA